MRTPSKSRGFSLVEVLVAIAVFALMMTIFAQIMSQARTVTSVESRKLAGFSGAISAFDRVGTDLSRRVRGPDAPLMSTTNATDFVFYAQVPNTTSASRLTKISYSMQDARVLRDATPVLWSDSMPIAANATADLPLSPEVFAIRFSFSRADGRNYPEPSPDRDDPDLALVVTLACLDTRIHSRLGDTAAAIAAITNFAANLDSLPNNGSAQTPLTLWENQLTANNPPFMLAPHVAVYERRFPLD